MTTLTAQLQALGFSNFTIWSGTPAIPPEPPRKRFSVGTFFVDLDPNGNPPLPPSDQIFSTIVTPPKDDSDLAALKSMPAVVNFVQMTPAQIDAYIDANVTSLAGAIAALKLMAKATSLSARAVFK